jgi:hypothetical protein
MALFPLKVESDEPGRRLVLAGQFPSVPPAALGCLAVVLLLLVAFPIVSALWSFFSGANGGLGIALFGLLSSLAFPAIILIALAAGVRNLKMVTRISVDGAADRIEITQTRLLARTRTSVETIPLADLRGMNVRAARPVSSSSGARDTGLAIQLSLLFRDETARTPRNLSFGVEGLDQREEAGDLALRIAGAAGLGYQRVVRSDPREIELEFGTLGAAGFTPLAAPVAKADYARDVVAPAAEALAAREETPSFDPATLQSEFKVVAWQPGQEVRFRRPLGLVAIGCAPGMLLLGLGPLLFYTMGRAATNTLQDRLIGAGVGGLFGLIFGGLAALVVYTSLPRTVAFDWMERRLRIKGLFRQREYDFAELRSIELKATRYHHSSSKGSSSYTNYGCDLIAHAGDPAQPKAIELLSTTSFREDPDTPYRMALPLATDLAKALGVKRVVTEAS